VKGEQPWRWVFGGVMMIVCACGFSTPQGEVSSPNEPAEEVLEVAQPEVIQPKIAPRRLSELGGYAKQYGYSTKYGLFADLGAFSGGERFHVVELQTGRVLHSGLVAHGHCKENAPGVRFSNESGSNCSSEGKYVIGESYMGQFGLAYKLKGLELTNSNAFERFIVMHAHPCVYEEASRDPICESEGCPTLSPAMLETVSDLLESEALPVLLWVYQAG
jgi:hypothetical protein